MGFKEALSIIKGLAGSQGFYSRLYRAMLEFTPEEVQDFEQLLKANNIKTPLDLVLALEG